MIPRMFIWLPAKAADLRGYLIDEDDIHSAVLVPLEVGTAIVFARPTRLRDGMGLAEAARAKSATTGVMFLWNDRAASVNPAAKSLAPGWDWGTDEARFDLFVRPNRLGLLTELLCRVIDFFFHSSRSGRAKQARAARRIARALHAPADIVLAHVRDWENGHDVVVDLLEATGKTDLARVARQIETGSYAVWHDARDLPVVPLIND
jgi:hypothetical protein